MIQRIEFNLEEMKKDEFYNFYPEKINIKSIEFDSPINILVGENGSGKTTILEFLRYLSFCETGFYSNLQNCTRSLTEKTNSILKLVDVYSDYDLTTYNLHNLTVKNFDAHTKSDEFYKMYNIQQFMDRKENSDGEQVLEDIMILFANMFGSAKIHPAPTHIDFSRFVDSIDDVLKPMYDNIMNYVNNHKCESKNKHTIIMDEPDKGLSLMNIRQILGILTHPRSDTQVIASIHNPFIIQLIRRHTEDKTIKIIETSSHYIDRIDDFMKENNISI